MTSSHRQALGRGLGALIPKTASGAGLETVDIDLIVPNPQQPRMTFDQEALNELAASIREHGVLQPVIVTVVPSELGPSMYQLIAGERRLQAARLAGLTRMPVVVREAAGKELLELALVENLQRQDLNPLEEAHAFVRLSDDFGLTQEQISDRVGRSRASIANTMRLPLLDEDIRASLASGQISEGHARALLQIEEQELRMDTWRMIVSEGLNVRQSEDVARALRAMQSAAPAQKRSTPPRRTDPHLRAVEDDLRHAVGAPVTVRQSGKGGSIVIRFHNAEELERIIARVVGG